VRFSRSKLTWALLAALVLLVVGLTKFAALQNRGPTEAADVAVTIDAPDEAQLYHANVPLAAGENTVLNALRAAADRDGFTVRTQDYAGLGAMVVQIFSYHNDGPCGWVYEVNGVSGDRSASLYHVSDGDAVHWFWACHG